MAVYIHSRMENFHNNGNMVTSAFFRQKIEAYYGEIERRIQELEIKKEEINKIAPEFIPILSAALSGKQKNGKRGVGELMNDITNDFKALRGDGNSSFKNGKFEVYLDNDSNGARLAKDLKELDKYITVAKLSGRKGTTFLQEMGKYPIFKYFTKNGGGNYRLSKDEFSKIFYSDNAIYKLFNLQKGFLWENALAYTGEKIGKNAAGTGIKCSVKTKVWNDNETLSDVNFIISREGFKNVSFNVEAKNYSDIAKWSKESETNFGIIFGENGILNDNTLYSILNTIILNTRRLDDLSEHPIQKRRLWGTLAKTKVNFASSFIEAPEIEDLYLSIAALAAIKRYVEQVKMERVASVVVFNDNVYWYVDYLKIVYDWFRQEDYGKLVSVKKIDFTIKNLVPLKAFSQLYVAKSSFLKEKTLQNNPKATKPEFLNESEWRNAALSSKKLNDEMQKIQDRFLKTVVKHKMWAVPRNLNNI